MSLASPAVERVRFGPFEADLTTRELFAAGKRIRLPNQSFIVLAVLLERAGQLVTREELRERVWPDNRVVEFEQGLNAVINRLREALGDSAENARFIETLPRRGYRFIAPVERVSTPPTEAPRPDAPVQTVAGPGVDSPPRASARSPNRLLALTRATLLFITFGLGVALVGVVVTALLREPAASNRAQSAQLVPFTSLLGQETAPTFSPDGRQIAFAWNGESGSSGKFDLYAKAVDSERLLRLTQHPAQALSAAWTPEGTQIAFARTAENGNGIFLIPALGGPERRLVDETFSYEPFMQLSWSPDSKVLAYSGMNATGSHQVRLLRLDTLESSPLKPIPECLETGAPAFSRDGKQLAFVCTSSVAVYAIYLTELPAGPHRLLASMLGYPRGLAWSADGSRLLLANDAGEGGALWELTLSGRLSRLPFGEDAIGPGVAVHSDRLAYVRGKQIVDIWRIDLAAPRPAESTSKLIFSTRAQLTPQYSPDARRIVFQSSRSGSPEIWLADADGGNPVRLTSFNGPLTGGPTWCSDGRRIAFDSRASGISAIYVMDVDERVPRPVKSTRDNLALPSWSEDCQWLFASDGKSTLYRVPATGGNATRLTERRAYYTSVGGDRVVFNLMQSNGVALWSIAVDERDEAPLAGMPMLAYSDAWAATRTGIYFTQSADDAASLNFYDFATRNTRRVMDLQQAPMPLGGLGLAVSRDERWLLYTRGGESQSDLMLARHVQ